MKKELEDTKRALKKALEEIALLKASVELAKTTEIIEKIPNALANCDESTTTSGDMEFEEDEGRKRKHSFSSSNESKEDSEVSQKFTKLVSTKSNQVSDSAISPQCKSKPEPSPPAKFNNPKKSKTGSGQKVLPLNNN